MTERGVSGNLGFTGADVSLIGAESCVVHVSYGVIRVFETTAGGLKLNPSHRARIPGGASGADVKKQRIVGSNAVTTQTPVFGIPRYFYADISSTCAGCTQSFVFTQDDQRCWYEEYSMPVYSTAAYCPACRREYALGDAVQAAIDARKAEPKNAALIVEEARQRIVHRECTGTGELNKPLALLRTAVEKTTDEAVRGDAYRWLAALEDLRGRPKESLKYYRMHLDAHAATPCAACAATAALLAR